jgi:hypothetical protein
VKRIALIIVLSAIILYGFQTSQKVSYSTTEHELLDRLLRTERSLKDVWKNTNIHKLQIIYTRILYDELGNVRLQDYSYNLSEDLYFYPASLVKLPVSVFALEKLDALAPVQATINSKISIESNYSCQSAVIVDDLSDNLIPTLSKYISKALIISDNDAYNRLYEFVGPEYCQKRLDNMGYKKARIITRFSNCNSIENRHTNGFNFYDNQGAIVYRQPPAFYNASIKPPLKDMKVGKAHFKKRKIIASPKDFSHSNYFPLQNMHDFLISLIYPSFSKKPLLINKKDRQFVLQCLSAKPSECSIQKIKNDTTFYDNYTNYLFYGSENKETTNKNIKIYNIVGQSYGFLSDVAYFQDKENKVEFFLSAVIYTNSSELVGNNGYDYDTIGFPFLRDLGRTIYRYELEQKEYK